MVTIIHSNGSKWGGQEPDNIERLLAVLADYPLDRSFEAFGNFASRNAVNRRGKPLDGIPGNYHFFGNFHGLSHVFRITTDDEEIGERLTAAICANQERPDYLAQPAPVPFNDCEQCGEPFRGEQGLCLRCRP